MAPSRILPLPPKIGSVCAASHRAPTPLHERGCAALPPFYPAYINETKTPPGFLPHKCPYPRGNFLVRRCLHSFNSPLTITDFAPSTVRPLAREDPRVLVGWPFPLDFGLDGRLLLARRGRIDVKFIIIITTIADFRCSRGVSRVLGIFFTAWVGL